MDRERVAFTASAFAMPLSSGARAGQYLVRFRVGTQAAQPVVADSGSHRAAASSKNTSSLVRHLQGVPPLLPRRLRLRLPDIDMHAVLRVLFVCCCMHAAGVHI
uniref:Uncharacterized protein n=1 Tax=Oryza brachyantha TaxID=4533 RepID=J3LWN0_ORYBR